MNLTAHWKEKILGIFIATIFSIGLFFGTWKSIVDIWIRSETFTHGFIIAPISVWLIWSQRDKYRDLTPCFSKLALIFIAANGFLWLISDLIHVLVFKQFAAIGILIGSFWALLGNRVAWEMLFPLSFLYFMVPVGEVLIPPLMEFTATFTVSLLRLTGISVYREGLFFTLTSGQWSVVEGCSGLRYLIASVTLGLVYAYITYTQPWKRFLFVLLSFLVPVIANGLRAYMIVMIAHLSDMKLATGVDHLIYGGIFFGFVMLILFFIGSFWKDAEPARPSRNNLVSQGTETEPYQPRILLIVLLIGITSSIWPLSSAWLQSKQSLGTQLHQNFSASHDVEWKPAGNPDWGWQPKFNGVVTETLDFYQNGQNTIGIYQASFGNESQGAELVNSQNYLVKQKDETWRLPYTGMMELTQPDGTSLPVNESVLSSNIRDIVVLRWYRIGDRNTANPYLAKIFQLMKRLSADPSPELQIIVMTEAPHNHYEIARTSLKRFAETWFNN
ncbi:MAG: exosortase A [Victivallales bacterium]|nr:exosortase A [Victivallales bacterium]